MTPVPRRPYPQRPGARVFAARQAFDDLEASMKITDTWQVFNGRWWAFCPAVVAAWATINGMEVRLVGPRATDVPVFGRYGATFGADGLVNCLTWIPPEQAIKLRRKIDLKILKSGREINRPLADLVSPFTTWRPA